MISGVEEAVLSKVALSFLGYLLPSMNPNEIFNPLSEAKAVVSKSLNEIDELFYDDMNEGDIRDYQLLKESAQTLNVDINRGLLKSSKAVNTLTLIFRFKGIVREARQIQSRSMILQGDVDDASRASKEKMKSRNDVRILNERNRLTEQIESENKLQIAIMRSDALRKGQDPGSVSDITHLMVPGNMPNFPSLSFPPNLLNYQVVNISNGRADEAPASMAISGPGGQ